jgi:hypothetical protein
MNNFITSLTVLKTPLGISLLSSSTYISVVTAMVKMKQKFHKEKKVPPSSTIRMLGIPLPERGRDDFGIGKDALILPFGTHS